MHDVAPLDPPDDDCPACAHCGHPATRQLTDTTFMCASLVCEAELSAQWCSSCGANVAEGEGHDSRCREDHLVDHADDDGDGDGDYYADAWEWAS
jgi:hypothetical protein